MRKLISSHPLAVMGALLLGSSLACAPAPVDKGNGPSTSGTGGSSSSSGTGGSSSSAGTGGSSSSSGTGGSPSSAGTGGSPSSSGTGGSPSSAGTGGSRGTGGSMSSTPDASTGTADMGPAAMGTKVPPEVQAVFMKACARCHPAAANSEYADATKTYARLKGNANANCGSMPRMKPGDGAGSIVVQKMKGAVAGCGAKMPPSGTAPTADEIKIVEDWITAGAKPVP